MKSQIQTAASMLAAASLAVLALAALPAVAHSTARGDAVSDAAAAGKVVMPERLRCFKDPYEPKICGKRFEDDWSKGWWSDPAEFEVVHVEIGILSLVDIPFDDYKSFSGKGSSTVASTKRLKGKVRLPGRRGRVNVSVLTAKPVKWKASSTGAWTTNDGSYDCGMPKWPGPDTGGFSGVFSRAPGGKIIRVQWTAIVPAGFDCVEDAPIEPIWGTLPTEATTVDYAAKGFRGAEIVRLPIEYDWKGTSGSADVDLTVMGEVVLRRVHHRIR